MLSRSPALTGGSLSVMNRQPPSSVAPTTETAPLRRVPKLALSVEEVRDSERAPGTFVNSHAARVSTAAAAEAQGASLHPDRAAGAKTSARVAPLPSRSHGTQAGRVNVDGTTGTASANESFGESIASFWLGALLSLVGTLGAAYLLQQL